MAVRKAIQSYDFPLQIGGISNVNSNITTIFQASYIGLRPYYRQMEEEICYWENLPI